MNLPLSIDQLYVHFQSCTGVSTDSRTVADGNLFFGLNGPNFKGSQYAKAALEKGAKYAIVDDSSISEEPNIFVVKDSLETLQALARHHRRQFQIPVIGITGSNGKTTSKELINAVLSKKYKTHATKGNLNNHIGVPLTLLDWPADLEIAIVEIGANHVGEIAQLSGICEPTHGLITNIGHAHTETFGGIEGVLRGKSELFDFLRKENGIPFINVLDERLKHMVKRFEQAVTYPTPELALGDGLEYLDVYWNGSLVRPQLTGSYNFPNVAVAIRMGEFFGVSAHDIVAAIEAYTPENMRSQIVKKEGRTIIVDAYNANPDSMKGALSNLSRFPGKKVAIIGDMNELENPDEAHAEIGEFIAKLGIEVVFLIGNKTKPALQFLPQAMHFESAEDFIRSKPELPIACTILLKASRTVQLEKIIPVV